MGEDERARAAHGGLELLASQSRSARTAVLQAKLRPAASPYLLPRPRLHQLLDESVTAPLTLVVAPAGSGKTSLLSSWVAETDLPHAWLSLDEDDRDPVQLWRGVLAALEGIAPGCARSAAHLLRRPGGLLEAVGELLDDLEGREQDHCVLVIDDLHLIDEVEANAVSLALFVQHLPPWLHVVVASRRALALPVHRLRARGQLGEVHFAEMRFTFAEASALLSRLAPALDHDAVAEVASGAGGWAASIQLAALAARSAQAQGGAYQPGPDESRVELADYVWREVLARESRDLVDVLLATSVVQHIEPDLARLLASRPDAAELLAAAEERGLFVSRVGTSEFEVHALVREALQGALAKQSPEQFARLHARAAGWHEAHGRTVSALEHWLRAARPREALRLLAAEAPALYDGGHASTILRTVEALPELELADGLDTMLELTWCHLLVDRRRYVGLVDRLARRVRRDPDVDLVLGARVEVLQSIGATLRGDWLDGASLARSALGSLGEEWWLDPLGQFGWNMIARDVALSERWDDASREARDVVQALGVLPERRTALEGTRALGEALAGRPVDALRLAAGARRASAATNMTVLRTEVLVAEAIAHRELGDTAAALPAFVELADGRIEPGPHCQLLARLELTHVRLDEGDVVSAARAFGLAAELVDTEMPGPGARAWLARTGALLALAEDDLAAARAWAAQVVDPFWAPVTAARVLLATGEFSAAADALKEAEPRNPRHQVMLDLLRSRTCQVEAEVDQCLLDAVRVAAGHGLVQTLVTEGADVVEAVERLAWRAPQAWLDRLRRVAQPAAPGVRDAGMFDPLTDRELEVLRMLPSRLTLREIADELFISINTLKFHLKVIYRKLGCASRAEAAEAARAMVSLRRADQPSSTLRRWTS